MNQLQYFSGLSLWQRFKLAWGIITTANLKPAIRFSNGVEFDLENNRVILHNPTEIHAKKTLKISSEEHIFIDSGRDFDPSTGVKHSIWLNNPEGVNHIPDIEVHVYDDAGNAYDVPATYDNEGNLIIPEGLYFQPPQKP